MRSLTPEEADDGRGWYLQHHAVYREDKASTKVRIVWNAAAQFQGVSLNDAFHKGPDLLNSLMSCLLAWRRDRVALVGDVRKMFNQIEVAASDQIYHRFVWRFGDENSLPRAFQWLRLQFGDQPAPDIATRMQPLDESDIERWKAHAIQMQELVTLEAKRCSGPAAVALLQRWWSKRLRCCSLATVDTR